MYKMPATARLMTKAGRRLSVRRASCLLIIHNHLSLTELGELLLKAYLDLDMYVAGAILLLLTFIIVFMNFVSDLLLAWLDPRIKLGA